MNGYMDLKQLERKLILAARAHPPSEVVPYAFEKRIMAYLAQRTISDPGAFWARALWRATAPCVGVMLLLASWSFFGTPATSSTDDLSQDLENTVFAAVEPDTTADPG